MKQDIILQEERENKTLNLRLQRIENKQTYNTYNTTNTTNNTTVNESKGLFSFLISIIKLPYTIPKTIILYFIEKTRLVYHIKSNNENRRRFEATERLMRRVRKGFKNNDNEIY